MKNNTGKKESLIFKFLYKLDLFWINIVVVAVVLIICAADLFSAEHYGAASTCVVFLLLLTGLNVLVSVIRKRRIKNLSKDLGFSEEDGKSYRGIVGGLKIPSFVISESCRLYWNNEEFKELCGKISQKPGAVAGGIFKEHIENAISNGNLEIKEPIKLNKRIYKLYVHFVRAEDISADNEIYICAYLIDVSGVERLKELYKSRKIVVGEIVIDDYDEIFQTNGETVASRVVLEVNNELEQWLEGKNAMVKRLDRERYVFLCETGTLKEIEKAHFDILEKVKKISVGNTIPVTISIGISTNEANITEEAFEALISGEFQEKAYVKAFTDTLPDHLAKSEQLINLCLNRGGDQAVVQSSEVLSESRFFGGSEFDQPRENTVQVRVTAQKIKDAVLESERVMIMGHKMADLDALGSALAMYRIATRLGKPAYIVLEGSNSQIDVAYESIVASGKYYDAIIKKNEALNVINEKTLVVLVDNISEKQCEAPEVLAVATKTGVIDHHRRGVEYIKNTIFDYTDTLASSTSELLTEIIRYIFPDENVLGKEEAEMLYGGILVDTKNLYFKTGKRTFEVMGYLRELGVSPLLVRNYVQPGYADYLEINKIVSTMDVINVDYKSQKKGIAFAHCDLSVDEANKLASIAADKMLEFTGVDCSFVLVKAGNGSILIKARSTGEINVQTIVENPAINGGGHLTAAAGVVTGMSISEVKTLILRIIQEKT